ncbi:PASTA domain-containing protein [Microaerobacter geothermalis]|uniref:PASTA domain-containing penicillin-binding protein n=1 Tax=Microaerobacter geothermalis TaxID=674972 RepID=UPI001F41FF37|nr:PASTA domain-containing penicillin-binding protein [Microaerobacter geothermalis]MCF6093598.1 PASTA domain-containing protein [Microaerobacter geothermalis]
MSYRQHVKIKSILIGILYTVLFLIILTRLFWLQSVNAELLTQKAQEMWKRNAVIEPKRGIIYDRNGSELAQNSKAYTVVATISKKDPERVKNPLEAARKLAPILNMSEEKLLKLLTREDLYQVELRPGGWKIDKETAQKVEALNIEGISFIESNKRYYPNRNFASHVLGYVNLDGKAVSGIENLFDKELRGIPGRYKFIKDAKGYELPEGVEDIQPAVDGKNIFLTIDQRIQQYAEQALDEAEMNFKPKRMSVIVANPKTGEILALANRPDFDPNEYWNFGGDYEKFNNFAVSSVFEPGSTFKIITLAAAIEEGEFNPDEKYQSGRLKVPGAIIPDHNNGKGWGKITFLEAVQRSSNVGFAILGYEKLKKERLFSYIDKFGFGKKTNIQLENEVPGLVKDISQAYPADVANISFGQGIGITAIQQVAAVSAVANGGKWIQPTIIKKIEDPNTGEETEVKPKVNRQIISPSTAKQVTEILETVVTQGTGQKYYIEGYDVVGKTGTAQKIGKDGKYKQDQYIFSFIGYAPKDDPQLLVYVVVDEPDVEYYQGADVVAPIFKSVMRNSLQYLGISPKVVEKETPEEKIISIPQLEGKPLLVAQQKLIELNLVPTILGGGNQVLKQIPQSGSQIVENSPIYLLTEELEKMAVPDFTGKSLREVYQLTQILQLKPLIEGNGYVVEQSPSPGTPLVNNLMITLKMAPKGISPEQE